MARACCACRRCGKGVVWTFSLSSIFSLLFLFRGTIGHDILWFQIIRGWTGGAKVLGKFSVPGRPTSLDDSRARAYCACSKCG